MPKKEGIRQFADLWGRGAGEKEGGGVFEGGGDTPVHTLNNKTFLRLRFL